NLETNQNKLVQIILVAQGEILTTLNRNDMRQLKSRIALNISIEALTLSELDQYVDFRLTRAGSNKKITLDKNALNLLHKLTKGYPRQVNLVMDRCLYVVAAFGNHKINKTLIAKAYEEISFPTANKQNLKFNQSWLAVASVIIIVAVYFSYQYKSLLINELEDINLSKLISNNDNKLVNLANIKKPISIPKFELESKLELTQSNSNIYSYLQQFGLSSLNESFTTSLKNNDFNSFENHLFLTFGYRVLFSDKKIRSKYGKEIWMFTIANNHRWLTFWKPDINLYAFYQGYYSQRIEILQNNLQDEGFYQSVIDGIVGEKTITAISKFQKSVGLNTSGFPDEMTLYQLQKSNINSLNIGTDLPASNNRNKTRNNNKVITKPVYSLANNSITTDLEQ
ncbi:MAG: peptidoglycan-binding protein, partial [Alcanivoracaceae bacterium]|nr:peptidoglycan-binding protein [Alcanivoracaceae bacterium]